MVDDEVKIYEDTLDTDEKNLPKQTYSALMKIQQAKNGSNSSNLCGQKVMNVIEYLMLKITYVKKI
jgi:hypothetical protein